MKGWTSGQIADKLAGGDKRRRKAIQWQVWRILATDEQIQKDLALVSTGQLVESLPGATAGLARRANRGNVMAVRLAMEAIGYYNPKQVHEHTGEVKVTINVPRAPKQIEEQVVDAEVVEEEDLAG